MIVGFKLHVIRNLLAATSKWCAGASRSRRTATPRLLCDGISSKGTPPMPHIFTFVSPGYIYSKFDTFIGINHSLDQLITIFTSARIAHYSVFTVISRRIFHHHHLVTLVTQPFLGVYLHAIRKVKNLGHNFAVIH